ncbi:MAG: pyridoxamine 5'-phosphate oxidase [Ignavibacteria bacterium]|nr:pyridoxamine 5'-phosphate oxidase [Ignavibacteria bacterium]
MKKESEVNLFQTISSLRRDYSRNKFDEKTAKDNPFEQFEIWFEEVLRMDFLEPNAMVLATSTKNGIPSARVVLLKKFDKTGFVFFTNYESQKGREIEENPNAALLFYWDKLERQVRINGIITKTSWEESNEYFQTRPYLSKIGAWASKQSQELKSRFTLIRSVANYIIKYANFVPLPPFWGGYRLVPNYFEFWQGRESRLHDRIAYYLQENGSWRKQRLYP